MTDRTAERTALQQPPKNIRSVMRLEDDLNATPIGGVDR